MAIEFKCPCGAALSADESKAGELVHCEACGLDVPAPKPGAQAEMPTFPAASAFAEATADKPAAGSGSEEPPVAEVVAEPPKGASALEGLRAAQGRGDVSEMIAQITGVRPTTSPADAAGGAPVAPLPAGTATGERPAAAPGLRVDLGPKARRQPGLPPPPTGTARAAHHFGFKRIMWLPSLIIGLLCFGLGAYCLLTFLLSSGTQIAYPVREFPADWQVVHDNLGNSWAIPSGTTLEPGKTGRMFYTNPSGYDEAAVDANEYAANLAKAEKAKDEADGKHRGYLWFAIGFVLVGVMLLPLSLWMRHHVQVVAREKEEVEAPPEAAPGAEPAEAKPSEPAQAKSAEPAEAKPSEPAAAKPSEPAADLSAEASAKAEAAGNPASSEQPPPAPGQ